MLQKAGRHGGYATQFWTKQRSAYRTRRDVLMAHSAKSVQRRLVLPLDVHDWSRALEVLSARYARLGRTTLDYQRVIRGIAADNVSPTRIQAGVKLLNGLRDEVYAGDVVSDGVWVTLLWAYVELRRPREGYECLLQAKRRVKMSPLTWHHMGETLIPLLAEFGMLAEARYVLENFMQPGGSLRERERAARMIAEAAARSGCWVDAMKELCGRPVGTAGSGTSKPRAPTLTSLFVTEAVDSTSSEKSTQASAASVNKHEGQLSLEAVRSMMRATARDGQWVLALTCLQELRRRQISSDQPGCHAPQYYVPPGDGLPRGSVPEGDKTTPCLPSVLTSGEIQELLNALGDQRRWEEAVGLFSEFYLPEHCGRRVGTHHSLEPLTLNLLFSAFPREMSVVTLTASDSGAEKELGSSQGSQTPGKSLERGGDETMKMTLQLDLVHHPRHVIKVLDKLLFERDDVVITDCMMGTIGPALVQLGQWDRALHLLRQAPGLSPAAQKDLKQLQHWESAATRRRMQDHLKTLLFYIYSTISLEARYYALLHFPHVFPPDVFRGLPPPKELAAHLQELQQNQQQTQECTENGTVKRIRHFASSRRSRTVQNTEQIDAELRERLFAVRANRCNAFPAGVDPEKDPRPIPKGLHDTANGWNFYGRGGEMVFANHRRTAHPFTMHPKVMRSLADPYRGWNLKQNSCWGHRERVKKWNGRSAV